MISSAPSAAARISRRAVVAGLAGACVMGCQDNTVHMIDIGQEVAPGLLRDSWANSRLGHELLQQAVVWRAQIERDTGQAFTQAQHLQAPEDLQMQQVQLFYERALGQGWEKRQAQADGCACAIWRRGRHALLLAWGMQPVKWADRPVRLVFAMATPASKN